MDISVIICTYNRSKSLERTLESLRNVFHPQGAEWEIIIVDNNSSDNTREVVERFIGSSMLPCKYVFENKQGLSYARNTGIGEAKGEILSFTDDDVIIDGHWLQNIENEFKNNEVACIGGKILPIWENTQPAWLKGDLLQFLALQDLGDEKIKLNSPVIWGANLSIRSAMFHEYGLFDPTLGNIEGKLYGGEETKFVRLLLEKGETVLYCPDILVHHCIPGFRMKKSYFRKWVYDKGELKAIQMEDVSSRNIRGVPLYILREAGGDFIRYLGKQVSSPHSAFHEQLILIHKIGTMAGRWKHLNGQAGS
jgi:glucosyl-dolichyl phosphate glucuronosyltransferase